jgi:hypothetical protein
MDGASTSTFAAGVTGTAKIAALAVQQIVKKPFPTEAIARLGWRVLSLVIFLSIGEAGVVR